MANKIDYKKVLGDFIADIDTKQYTDEEIFGAYPEFNNDKALLDAAYQYANTVKANKYNEPTLQSKFPEFFAPTQPASSAQPAEPVADANGVISITPEQLHNPDNQNPNWQTQQPSKPAATIQGRELKMDEVVRPKGFEDLNVFELADQIDALSNPHDAKARELYKARYGKDYVGLKKPEEPTNWWKKLTPSPEYTAYAEEKRRYDEALLDAGRIEMQENPEASKKRQEQLALLKQEKAWRDQQIVMPKLGEEIKDLQQRILSNEKQDGVDMRGAKHLLNQTIDLYNAPSKYGRGNGIVNWGQGLADQITDYDTWTAGVTDLARMGNLNGIVNKMNKGGYNSLTKEEQLVLDAFLISTAVQDIRSDLSQGYEIGKGAAESIPFMVEMYLTAGAGVLAKKGLVQLAERKVGKAFAEKLARSLGGTVIRDAAGKMVERGATQTVAGNVGKTLAYDFAQTAAMPSTYANIYKDRVTEILQGDGNYNFTDFARTFTGQMVETGTERWGGRIIDKGVSKFIPINADNLWGKSKLFGRFVENYINSPIGETGEEVIAAGVNTLRSLNPIYNHVDEKSVSSNQRLRGELGEMLSPEGLSKTFLTILPMSIFGGGANAAINRMAANAVVRDYGQSRQAMQSLLESSGATPEEANRIVNQIEASDSDRAFFDKMNMAYNNLLNKYMMENPNAPIEDVKAYQQQLDQVLGDYTKQAGAYNQMVGDLMEKYEKLPEEEKRNVDSAMEDYMVRSAEELAAKQLQKQEQPIQEVEAPTEEVNPQIFEQENAFRQQISDELAPNTHNNGYLYPVKQAGENGKTGYIVSGDVVVDESNPGKLSITNNDLVTVKYEDGTVEQMSAKYLDLTSAPMMATDAIESMVEQRIDEFTLQRIANGEEPIMLQDQQGNVEGFFPTDQDGIIEDKHGRRFNIDELGQQGWQAIQMDEQGNTQLVPIEQLRAASQTEDEGQGTIEGEASSVIESEASKGTPAYPTDEEGNPAWGQIEVPHAAQILYDTFKQNNPAAISYAEDQLKEAEKVQKKAASQKSHSLNIAQRIAEDEQNAQFKAAADAAVKYWQNVKQSISQIKSPEEIAAEEEKRAKDAAIAAARRKTEEGLVGGQPAERWNNAPKIAGNAVTRTLPDGTKIAGHYVLAEAGAATPSHNPFNNWNTSEGFPVTEDGRNINDRDYKNDKDAQQITMQIAQTYDGQAVQQVPVVSSIGIVYDGNGRTIAGNIAAANNTDAAYLQALAENAANFGFTPEQVASMQHPRVYLQTDEDMPYNTTTFAKFNAQEKKTMNSVQRAISNAKKLTDAARDGLLRVINSYSSLDAFFASEAGAKSILNLLQSNNIITEQEAPEWRDNTETGFVLSSDGRSGITDLLIGALFDEQTIRMLGNDKGLKQSILRAMPSIVENRQLGDYALTDDINEAIRLLYEARQAGMVYKLFVRQGNLIDGYVKDRFSAFSMLLAEEMSSGVDKFRQVLDIYNNSARDDANGQSVMFDRRTPEDIKNQTLKRYEQEQQPAEPAGEQPARKETQPSVPSTPASNEPATEVTPEERLAQAEAETDTNPTEAQKKAENYKQGHVTLWGLPITIENPKGSIRRGTDANGKQWEQEMHHTYGKIRRTEGVDGDHIDVFIGPNLTSDKVFVVDQRNVDTGEFDEHKCMLGFDSLEEAQNGYLSNYEEGWQGMGTVTEVTMDEFKKWINSSHRKTKPFAEYKSVKTEDAASTAMEQPAQEQEQPEPVRAKHAFEVTISDINGFIDRCANNYFKNYALNNDALDTFYDQQVGKHIIAGAPYVDGAYILEVLHTANEELDKLKGKRDKYSSIKKRVFSNLVRDIQAGLSQPVSVGENAENSIKDTKNAKNSTKNAENVEQNLQESEKSSTFAGVNNDNNGDTSTTVPETSPTGAAPQATNGEGAQDAGEAGGLGSNRPTSGSRLPNPQSSQFEQEEELEREAKANGTWLNFGDIRDSAARRLPSGKEADVFLSQDGKHVIKVIKYFQYSQTPYDFLRDRVELFNLLFPETAYRLLGYTRNAEGQFCPVVEQPFIEGHLLEDYWLATKGKVKYSELEPMLERYMLEKHGMHKYGLDAYEDDLYRVQDLHLKNVRIDDEGNMYVIDAVPSYRPTEEKGGEKPTRKQEQTTEQLGTNNSEVVSKQPHNQQQTNFESNSVFTADAVAEARKRLAARRNRLNMGLNPEDAYDYTIIAGAYVEQGVRKFADFCKAMIQDLGDAVRPYLQSIYDSLRHDPQVKAQGWNKDFDSHDVVDNFDVDNFAVEEEQPEEQLKAAFEVGQKVKYYNKVDKTYHDAEVESVNADGTYNITTPSPIFGDIHMNNISEDRLSAIEEKPKEPEKKPAAERTLGTIRQSKNTKTGAEIYVVSLTDHVSNDEFKVLKTRARANGGYYSSFAKNRGFIFNTEEDAKRFNTINDEEVTDAQTSANTEAVISQAETVAAEAAAIGQDGEDRSGAEGEQRTEDAPASVGAVGTVKPQAQPELSPEEADAAVTECKEAISKIDDTVEHINEQLAVLGYYQADETKDFHEYYGYMKSAEKKAVADADKLGKQLATDLGIEVNKRKKVASANLSQIGGDVKISLPLPEGRELNIWISVRPNAQVTAADGHRDDGTTDSLVVQSIMWRVDHQTGYGSNNWEWKEVTYQQLLKNIRRIAKNYLPEVKPEQVDVPELPANPTMMDVVEQAKARKEAITKKRSKNSVQDGQQVLSLFDDVVDEINDGIAQENSTPAIAEQTEPKPVKNQTEFTEDDITPAISRVRLKDGSIKQVLMVTHTQDIKSNEKPKLEQIMFTDGTTAKFEDIAAINVDESVEDPRHGYKVGDEVIFRSKGSASRKPQKVKIVDFEKDGRPIVDSFGTNYITEIADWDDIEPINNEDNGSTEVRNDGERESSTPQGRTAGQPADQNGTLGGSQRQANEGTQSGGVGSSSEQHRVHDGERGLGTTGQRSTESVEEPVAESERKNTHNFRYDPNDPAPTSNKARYEANLAAIRLLKQLQDEGRQATPEEQRVLAKFTGWGGLGEFFKGEPGTTYWSDHGEKSPYQVIKELLTDEEMQAAQLSRNSAYFTPPAIIDELWSIAQHLGFKGGNILEGSAGIGNILSQMPQSISDRSNLQAVEIDTITAGILAQLYPDAQTHAAGFQEVDIPNNSQDLVITNVPFVTGLRVYDKKEKDLSKRFGNIHDFCIAKNVRKLRQGGLGIFITTSGTLDSSKDLRRWLNTEGETDVIGAFRLNRETFGGTSATSDIIVVRKRVNGQKDPRAIDVLDTAVARVAETEEDGKNVEKKLIYNRYFVEHPENMGGEMGFGFEHGDTRWGGTTAGCYPSPSINQSERLNDFVDNMSADGAQTYTVQEPSPFVSSGTYETYEGAVPYGSLILNSKGEICRAYKGMAVPVEGINPTKVKGHEKSEVLKDYNALKAAVEELLRLQSQGVEDEGLNILMKKLNKVYDDFVKKYGYLNRNVSLSFLRNDVQWASMAALENVRETIDRNGKKKVEVTKTDVFSKRVVGVQPTPKADNAKDGVILSVQQYGNVRPDRIAEWLGKPQDEVEKEIIASRLAFRDPQTGNMVVSHEYLSGNVREKLAYAEEHNENGIYDTNIEELHKVIPVDIPAHLIEFNIGSTWIPVELYHEYLKEKFGVDSLQLTHVGSAWLSNEKSWGTYTLHGEKNRSEGVYSDLLQQQIYGHQLMIAAMNNVPVVVSRVEKHYDGSTETITDKVATAACSDKISQIKDDFVEWARGKMQQDPELADRVQKIYNERFNAIVPMLSVDKAFLSPHLPGQNPKYTLYDHQQQAVVRGTTQPIMLAHEVGTGKTITLISTAMEMRRLGTAKKPMIVVQNATTPQFVKEAKDLYPNAKILTVSERDRTKEGRQEFYAKIKYNDWDLIIVPQSVFDMIPDSEARMRDFIQDKIDEKLHAIEAAKEAKVDEKVTKRMEKELEALQEDLQNANMSGKKTTKKSTEKDAKKEAERIANATAQAEEMLDRRTDEVEDFDDMGIDALLIDEAHNYKHLGFATMMTRGVKGIDPSYSKRAAALFLKCQSIYDRKGHRNVVFATGTPISNTAAEIWTFMKYLMPKSVLKENDIYYFDDFVHNFGKIAEQLEFATNGKFKANNRFAQYGNVPELMRLWLTCADCVLTREVGQVNDKVPELEGGKAQDIFLPQSPSLIDIMASVREELDRYEHMSGKEKKENSHIPLTMYGVAKRAAIDPRLVDATAADEPLSKTNKAVEETLRSLKETKKYNGTVAIFCDSYRNLQSGFNLFEDIKAKLIKGGVPAAKIAIIRSEMTDAAKQKIFDAVREGEIRVIMGSTQTLGTGVNIQTRLHTLIHMDAPDRPMDYTQRNGRIIRQGNMHRQWNIPVRVLRFGVEDSLDVTSYQRLKTKAGFIDSIMNGKSMIDNNLENRVIEDVEEGIFDNPVAMLSGSQYALLKSQAERDLRKWQARKQQHDIDQILIASGLKKNASIIEYRKNLIATDEKFLQQLKETFPTGKVTEYNINGTICHTPEEVKAALKAVNKDISDQSDALRKNGYEGDKRNIGLALQFNGMTFNVNIVLTYKSRWEGGQRAITIDKEVQYTSPTSDTWLASPTKVIDKLVENIEQDYLSGVQAQGEINYSRNYIARLQQESELMRQREGKPFEHTAELERAQALVDEYTEKMKAELAEKEAKYANMSSGRAVTLNEQDDEEETPEAQITSLDYPQFTNQTEAQQLATRALIETLHDNTDLNVFLATDEQMPEDGSEKDVRNDKYSQVATDAWNKYQYDGELESIRDVAEYIEENMPKDETTTPLFDAIDKYRVEEEEDRMLYGERGDLEPFADAILAEIEKLMQPTREPMVTSDGTLYGWAIGDKIYLTKAGLNPNTPIHEYTHLWAKAMRRNNQEGWQSIVDIFKGTPFWDEVVNDPNYQGLTTDDAICSEVLARYSGQRGAARMEEAAAELMDEAKKSGRMNIVNTRSLIDKVKDAIRKFWRWVGTNLFDIKHFDDMNDVADRVLYDMLSGTKLGDLKGGISEAMFSPEKQKQVSEWDAAHPRPVYQIGEKLDAYWARYSQWKQERDKFRASMEGAKTAPPVESTPNDRSSSPITTGENGNQAPGSANRPYSMGEFRKSVIIARDAELEEELLARFDKEFGMRRATVEKVTLKNAWKERDRIIENIYQDFVDKFSAIERFQDWIIKEGGEFNEDTMDAHGDTSMSRGRIATAYTYFDRNLLEHIWTAIRDIKTKSEEAAKNGDTTGTGHLNGLNMTWRNVESKTDNGRQLTIREIMGVYAQAKDCAEAEDKGLEDRGAAGFENNLGMTFEQVIKAVESRLTTEQINAFWSAVKAANQYALDYQVKGGIITQEQRDKYNRDFYVPQRGWRERDFDGVETKYTKGENDRLYENPFNPALVRARGRTSLASDPFAYIESIGKTSIIQAEHNIVKQRFLELTQANESLGRRSGAWTAYQVYAKNDIDPATGRIRLDANGNPVPPTAVTASPTQEEQEHDRELQSQIDKLRTKRRNKARLYAAMVNRDKIGDKVQEELDKIDDEINDKVSQLYYAGRVTDSMLSQRKRDEKRQHRVVVLKEGRQYVIELRDEELANAINGNFDSHIAKCLKAGKDIKLFAKLTRGYAAMMTQYSPRFAHRNFWRDVQAAVINNASEYGRAFTLKALYNIPAVQKAVWKYIVNDMFRDQTVYDESTDMGRYLREYFENGAQTGFSFMLDMQEMAKEVDKRIEGKNRKEKVTDFCLATASCMTEASELTVRFAQYVTARQMGYSEFKAAKMAKSITVNFDQSGLISKELSAYFTFFNANIQGNARFVIPQGKQRPTGGRMAAGFMKWAMKKTLKVGALYAVVGFLSNLLQPDDPDDEIWFTDYDRNAYFIFGKWKLPVTHYFRMFWAAGAQAALATQGRKTWTDALSTSMNFALDEIVPTSVFQIHNLWDYNKATNEVEFNAKKYWQGAAPSIVSPLTDVRLNIDYRGLPVHYENRYKDNQKDISQAKRNTPSPYVVTAEGLHYLSGGDPTVKTKGGVTDGSIDINPSDLQHVVEGWTPGAISSVVQLGMGVYKLFRDGEINKSDIVFFRDLQRDWQAEQSYKAEYFTLRNRLDVYEQRYNEMNAAQQALEERTGRYQAYTAAKDVFNEATKPEYGEDQTFTAAQVKALMEANERVNRDMFDESWFEGYKYQRAK